MVTILIGLVLTSNCVADDNTVVTPAVDTMLGFGLGCIPSRPEAFSVPEPGLSLSNLPSVVDNSGYLPIAGNQGTQNSCVGWAVAYGYKSFQEAKEHGWALDNYSNIFSPSYIYNQRSTSNCTQDSGMSVPDAMRIVLEQGCAPMAVFPYDADDPCRQPDASALEAASNFKITSYSPIFIGQGTANIEQLKGYIARGDVFVLAFPVYAEFFDLSCNNMLIGTPDAGESYFGGHAVLAVGYDNVVGGFKILNSYGTGWKCDGYAYLSYDFVQQYAWEAWKMVDDESPIVPTVEPESTVTPTPNPTATATIPDQTVLPSPTEIATSTPTIHITATSSPSETPPVTVVVTATPTPGPSKFPWPASICPGTLSLPFVSVGLVMLSRRRMTHWHRSE